LTKSAGSGNELRSNQLYPEAEAKNPKSEELEANSEARHFKRSWKQKQKIFYCFHIPDLADTGMQTIIHS